MTHHPLTPNETRMMRLLILCAAPRRMYVPHCQNSFFSDVNLSAEECKETLKNLAHKKFLKIANKSGSGFKTFHILKTLKEGKL